MAEPDIPSADAEPARYEGRPLLVILESYVLAAIGELPRDKNLRITAVVRKAFGGGVDWMATVRQAAGLPESFDSEIRTMWSRTRTRAEGAGQGLLPVQFAKMVADENFLHLVEKQ
jgi:hypothetical protein